MIRQFRARLTSLSSCNFVKVSTCLQHLQKPTHYATDSCTISMNSLIRISFRGYSTTAKDAIQITAFNFNKEVAQWTQGLIVLVLYSEASPDCKQYVANLKSCASKYNTSCERVRIALINCDLEHQIARQFQVEITGIPATYFLFKGSVCDRHIGVMHLPQITSAIAMLIKSLGEEFPSKKPQESSNGSLENSSALLLEDSVRALEEKNVDEAETIAKKVIEELASDLNSFKTSIGCGQRKMTPEMLNKLKDNFAAQQTLKALVILAQCALISEKSAHEYVNRIQTDFIWAVKEQREVGDIVAQFEMSTIAPLSRADTVETLSLATSTSQEEYPRVLKLAHWYYKNQGASKAIELLLDVISKESKWGIQRLEKNSKSTPARRMIVLIFDALGNDSQMVKEGRKKLSTYLFC